jgi:transcriptional regulator with XRE-family HTH domain
MAKRLQDPKSKLQRIREVEGWTRSELARQSGINAATLRKAELGEPVRTDIWGRILKGINSMANKSRIYELRDIQNGA